MTPAPQDTAAPPPPGGPPPRATAAVKPGPGPLTPVADHPGPGTPPEPARVHSPARCRHCGHGEAVHHGVSDRETPSTECSVIVGPRGARCGCKRYEAAAADLIREQS